MSERCSNKECRSYCISYLGNCSKSSKLDVIQGCKDYKPTKPEGGKDE